MRNRKELKLNSLSLSSLKEREMRTIVVFVVFMCLFCCTDKKQQESTTTEVEEKGIPVLDIAGKVSSSIPDTFTWNSIAKSVSLVPLSNKHLLSASLSINFLSPDLDVNLISDDRMGRVCYFGADGNLKSSFKKKGNGPGEYIYLTAVLFNQKDSTILVYDGHSGKLITYSNDGKFIHEKTIKDGMAIRSIDEYGFIYARSTSESSLMSVLNPEWEEIAQMVPCDSTETPREKAAHNICSTRSNTKDRCVVNRFYNDTVFVMGKDSLQPICILNKGSHALPIKEEVNILRLPKSNDYFTYTGIDVFSHYLKYSYIFQGMEQIELWDLETENKVAFSVRNIFDPVEKEKPVGVNFIFDSGTKIRIMPIYVTHSRLAFLLPAEDCVGEIEGVKEDDNPVLLVMDLK